MNFAVKKSIFVAQNELTYPMICTQISQLKKKPVASLAIFIDGFLKDRKVTRDRIKIFSFKTFSEAFT